MDPNQGGGVPPTDQPVTPVADVPTPTPESQPEPTLSAPEPEQGDVGGGGEKCSTCGNQTSGCTCGPTAPVV